MIFDPVVLNIVLILGAWAIFLVVDSFFPPNKWYFYAAIAFTVLMVAIFITVNLFNAFNHIKHKPIIGETNSTDGQIVPTPTSAPMTPPKWVSRGEWAIPFSVRYCVSYIGSGGNEGQCGPWSPYYSSTEFSNPVLMNFPKSNDESADIKKIKIYRQFEGHQPLAIDTVSYPFNEEYTDLSGDDY